MIGDHPLEKIRVPLTCNLQLICCPPEGSEHLPGFLEGSLVFPIEITQDISLRLGGPLDPRQDPHRPTSAQHLVDLTVDLRYTLFALARHRMFRAGVFHKSGCRWGGSAAVLPSSAATGSPTSVPWRETS